MVASKVIEVELKLIFPTVPLLQSKTKFDKSQKMYARAHLIWNQTVCVLKRKSLITTRKCTSFHSIYRGKRKWTKRGSNCVIYLEWQWICWPYIFSVKEAARASGWLLSTATTRGPVISNSDDISKPLNPSAVTPRATHQALPCVICVFNTCSSHVINMSIIAPLLVINHKYYRSAPHLFTHPVDK